MRRVAIVAALAFALGACGADDEGGGSGGSGGGSSSSGSSGEESRRYPEAVRKNFLDSCDAQPGAKRSVCECSLEYIEQRLTLDEFEEIERKLDEGAELPPVLERSVTACA